MQIVKTIKSKYRSDKYYIYFQDESVCEISPDVLLKYNISIGREINEAEMKLIMSDQNFINAKQSAYIFAAYKPRSEKQVRDKLKGMKYDQDKINFAIDFVSDFNLIDDNKFAISFVKDYLQRKPSSISKLKMELKIKGIDLQIIDKTLLEFGIEENELEFAIKSAEKKLKKINFKPKEKHKELVKTHLLREGFKYDLIKQVIEKMF